MRTQQVSKLRRAAPTRLHRMAYGLVLISVCLALPGVSLAEPTPLADLLAEARANNPRIAEAAHGWEAQEEAVNSARAWDDPRLALQAVNIPTGDVALDRTPMSGVQVGLAQRLPFPGKLALRKKAAVAGAQAASEMLEQTLNEVLEDVAATYHRLAYLNEAIVVTNKNMDLLRDFVEIAERKYAVGNGRQQDVLKAQVALSTLTDKLLSLERDRVRAGHHLLRLLNRPADTPVPETGFSDVAPPPADLDTLWALAREHNPVLAAVRANAEQADYRTALARRDYWPDMDVSVAYRFRQEVAMDPVSGEDFVTAGVAVPLPIWRGNKLAPRVREAAARTAAVRSQQRDVANAIAAGLGQAFADLTTAASQTALFDKTILPQARLSLESARVGYQVDKVDFLTLLDAQITLFDYDIDLARVRRNYGVALARIETLVGLPAQTIRTSKPGEPEGSPDASPDSSEVSP